MLHTIVNNDESIRQVFASRGSRNSVEVPDSQLILPTSLLVMAGFVVESVNGITARRVPTAGRIIGKRDIAIDVCRGSSVLTSSAAFFCIKAAVTSPAFIRHNPSSVETLGSQRQVAPSVRAEGGRINVALVGGVISTG